MIAGEGGSRLRRRSLMVVAEIMGGPDKPGHDDK
jgi:hypothetical protein